MKSFASDNYASVHPRILKAIEKANKGHAKAYGYDPYSEELQDIIQDIFGKGASAFPVFNGSGANVIGLKSLCKSYEAILCSDVSHINVDECGAAEQLVGSKLIDVPTQYGKLTPEALSPFTKNYGNEHQVQAKVLSLTQTTERGTVYSRQELKALGAFAKQNSIKVAMDGARFSNAVAALGAKPVEICKAAQVDVLSLGGTKNGLMLGELVIVFNPQVADDMRFYRKQYLQLSSKMRFISAQFVEYFKNNLWIHNALHSNEMAQLLKGELKKFSELEITQEVAANVVFVKVPRSLIEPLQQKFPFYVWDESLNECRWMCSFDTSPSDVKNFSREISKLLKKH
jgi:threonine aldolase